MVFENLFVFHSQQVEITDLLLVLMQDTQLEVWVIRDTLKIMYLSAVYKLWSMCVCVSACVCLYVCVHVCVRVASNVGLLHNRSSVLGVYHCV